MNQINEITINGFFDNDNHKLVFTPQSNLLNEIDEFTNYLDNLFILSNQISKKIQSNDIERLIADLKLLYISKIVFNVLNTFIDLYNKSVVEDNLKDVDKQNILSQFWIKIQPDETDKIDNLSKWADNFNRSAPYLDESGSIIFRDPPEITDDDESSNLTPAVLLEKIIKIKDIFDECYKKKRKSRKNY